MIYVYVPIYARNAVLSDETKNILAELADLASNATVKKWVANRFKKYLIEEYGSEIYSPREDDAAWVKEALDNGETVYYVSVSEDDYTRYKQYIKYLNTLPQKQVVGLSVADVVKRYDSFFKKQNADETEGVKTVYKFSNGYRVVELMTEKALQLEGKRMAHCIFKPEYWARIKFGLQRHFSLRDRQNDPHVTIEYNIEDNKVTQIKGYRDEKPRSQYYPMLVEFLESLTKHYKCVDYNELCIVSVGGKPTSLEEAIDNNLEMDGEVVVPPNYAVKNPNIGNIRSSRMVYVKYFQCNFITSLFSKEAIAVGSITCDYIESIQAPEIVLSTNNIRSITSIVADALSISGGKYGTIDSISCKENTSFERVIIDRINRCSVSSNVPLVINHSCIRYLYLCCMGTLVITNSKLVIHWDSVEKHRIQNSDITLLDSRVEQEVLFNSCNLKLQNSRCNNLVIENSSKSTLEVDRKSSIANLVIQGNVDNEFLSNIKRYSSRISQVSSSENNKRAILDAGFKFKLLKHEIKSCTSEVLSLSEKVNLISLALHTKISNIEDEVHAPQDLRSKDSLFPVYKIIPKNTWKPIDKYAYINF